MSTNTEQAENYSFLGHESFPCKMLWQKKRLFTLLVVALCCLQAACPQSLDDSISSRLQRQLALFPQEKVCLHTDRTVFLPGDSICLKVYVADAATLVPVLQSQYVYVELLNGQQRPLQRKRLIASNNLYTGYINLPPDQEPGVYYLWAYSRYSAQLRSYDCLVPIQVGSEAPTAAAGKPVPEMRFFPEGGYLVDGATCMVAFEATTSRGDSLHLSGEVVNRAGRVVSRFATQHRGLGVFSLAVEPGEQYTAQCRHADGRRYSFPLPRARADAACLQCRLADGVMQVSANCGPDFDGRPLYLLIHCRGRKVSLRQISPGTVYQLTVDKLPAGVNSLLLIDDDARVLSERLVFSANDASRLPLSVESTAARFGLRDSIPLTLSLPDGPEGEFAFLSLSVTDDGITHGRHSPSLWSQLLLTSDVQGFVPQPDDYFTPVVQSAMLDLLMMVNGWRRYDLPSVLKGRYAQPSVPHEYSQSVEGRVRAVFRNQPVANAEVVLAVTKQKRLETTTTDSLGRFAFHDLNFPDDADVFVYARRQKDRRCLVEVDKQRGVFSPDMKVVQRAAKWVPWLEVDNNLLSQYARDSHLLDEVVVKGKATGSYADNPTLSFDRRQIEEGNYHSFAMLLLCTNLLDVDYGSGRISADLMDVSGVERLWNVGKLQTNLGRSSLVRLYVNGTEVPGLTFEDIEVDEIDRMDLYLGTRAQIFGVDSGGVVNITMRRGLDRTTDNIFNNKVVQLEGYQAPAEYYYPRYPRGQAAAPEPDVRRTLYWNPYLRMAGGTPLSLSFYSADIPTAYTVRVEGLTSHGRVVDGQLSLRVGE